MWVGLRRILSKQKLDRGTEQVSFHLKIKSVTNTKVRPILSPHFQLFSPGPPRLEQDDAEVKSEGVKLHADGQEQRPQHHGGHPENDVCVLPLEQVGRHVAPQVDDAEENGQDAKHDGAQHVLFEQEGVVLRCGAPADYRGHQAEEPGVLPGPRVG